MQQRTVITGGAGFIGSHLCDYFVEQGHDVVCLDDLLTGAASHVEHLLGNPNFTFIHYDVTEYIHVGGRVDNVLHFASPASPVDYLEYPIQTLKVGALGTHKALGLAKSKDARFLLASTSEVYGDPQRHPQPEDYWGNVNPVGPRGVYDEAKRYAEALTMAYHRYHGVDTRIARIFNTYGPRMRLYDGRALPTFFRQALMGNPLTVYGDGSQTRSFCHIQDTVRGIALLLDSDQHDPVNIGNPDELTIRELADEIVEITCSDSEIVYQPLPEDDPQVRQPDITRARQVLGWEPRIDRREGLRMVLEYFQRAVNQEAEQQNR
ncbi:MAG: SDR family oxidoreductase [Planctomycetes bacterium]|nr:SDR family oxidoreductase [Planctomycetota bacterium]